MNAKIDFSSYHSTAVYAYNMTPMFSFQRGNTPLHIACYFGNYDIVTELLKRCPRDETKAFLNAQNEVSISGSTDSLHVGIYTHSLILLVCLMHT